MLGSVSPVPAADATGGAGGGGDAAARAVSSAGSFARHAAATRNSRTALELRLMFTTPVRVGHSGMWPYPAVSLASSLMRQREEFVARHRTVTEETAQRARDRL